MTIHLKKINDFGGKNGGGGGGGGGDFKGLCIETTENDCVIAFYGGGNASLKYSTDGINWNLFRDNSIGISNSILLKNVGDKVFIKGYYTGQSTSNYMYFYTSKYVKASGNLFSIIDEENFETMTSLSIRYCFYKLFYNCTKLLTAPELPLTLEVNNASQWCYAEMFSGCTGLTEIPKLPSNTTSYYCYYRMFNGCTSLTKAEFDATDIRDYCCNEMFKGCSALNNIKVKFTRGFSTTYFNNWVNGVSATGDFYYNGSDTSRGVSAIPEGWTVHTF